MSTTKTVPLGSVRAPERGVIYIIMPEGFDEADCAAVIHGLNANIAALADQLRFEVLIIRGRTTWGVRLVFRIKETDVHDELFGRVVAELDEQIRLRRLLVEAVARV